MQVPIEIYSPIACNSGHDAVWTGVVHDPDLDVIFRYFNRVDQADADRLRAIGYELPSMTAGDLIHFTEPDRWVLVCCLGFADLSDHHVSEILNSEDPYLTAMLYARGGGKIEAASTN